MNRGELEQRGWVFKSEYDGISKYQKGDIWKLNGLGAFLDVKEGRIKIITTDDGYNQSGPNSSPKYNGKCENIEQFDMICEMIELRC